MLPRRPQAGGQWSVMWAALSAVLPSSPWPVPSHTAQSGDNLTLQLHRHSGI